MLYLGMFGFNDARCRGSEIEDAASDFPVKGGASKLYSRFLWRRCYVMNVYILCRRVNALAVKKTYYVAQLP